MKKKQKKNNKINKIRLELPLKKNFKQKIYMLKAKKNK